jgi:hypothetical protein
MNAPHAPSCTLQQSIIRSILWAVCQVARMDCCLMTIVQDVFKIERWMNAGNGYELKKEMK